MKSEQEEINAQLVKQAIGSGAKINTALKNSIVSLKQQDREELLKLVISRKKEALEVQNFEKASNLRHIENEINNTVSIMNAITIQDFEDKLKKDNVKLIDILKQKTNVDSFKSLVQNIQHGELVVIASRPNVGKTNFLYNLLINQEIGDNEKILLLSARTKPETVLINIDRLINSSDTLITKNTILINTEPFKNPIDAMEFVKRAMKKYNIRGIYFDDLNILSYFYDFGIEETEDMVSDEEHIKILLVFLAITGSKNKIPIIITEQTNRNNTFRSGEMRIKHELSDIRNEMFEIIANKILLLYRYGYYEITEDVEGNSTENIMNVMIAKNTSGDSGKILSLKMNSDKIYK